MEKSKIILNPERAGEKVLSAPYTYDERKANWGKNRANGAGKYENWISGIVPTTCDEILFRYCSDPAAELMAMLERKLTGCTLDSTHYEFAGVDERGETLFFYVDGVDTDICDDEE